MTIKSIEHKDQEAFQNSEEFKGKAKSRYKIEAKNSELQHRHGLICGESQASYDFNEGIKIKKHRVKARFHSEMNEISPFFSNSPKN